MGKTNLDETYIFKIRIKCDSFDVTIGIKIPFMRVSIPIELDRSLLQLNKKNKFFQLKVRSDIKT